MTVTVYTVVHKNVALFFCPYFCQLLADFQKFFHWHILQTICNTGNVIIMYLTAP